MATKQFWNLLYLTVFLSFALATVNSTPTNGGLEDVDNLLKKTLFALKGTLEFFNGEYKNINLDAAIGTRIVDGR